MIFGGFGPIIAGIVFFILDFTVPAFSLSGCEVLLAVVSTYLLAFVHAGASVFNQIEHWPLARSLACHLGSLYLAYMLCYIVNSWIPFEPIAVALFTAAFVATYFIIWFVIVLSIKAASRKMSEKLK